MGWGRGEVMIKMVGIILSKGVGRGQEEKARVSPQMLFFIQRVYSRWKFVYSSGVTCPFVFRLCVVGHFLRRKDAA